MDSSGGTQAYAFIADLYDHVVPYRERPDVDFYVEAARLSGEPVLELGWGTGRVLIATAREGIEIVGLDISPYMLHVCQNQLSLEPEEIQARVYLKQADMRDFSLDRLFKLVMIPFRPFQHLITVKDQLAYLECVHHHLIEDGRLVFDVFNPSLKALTRNDNGEEIGEEPEFTTPDGRSVIRWHKIVSRDRFKQINDVELIYYVTHPEGREERLIHSFPMRYFFRFEIELLLVRSGFETKQLYADFDKSPYGSKYPGDLIFAAKKEIN